MPAPSNHQERRRQGVPSSISCPNKDAGPKPTVRLSRWYAAVPRRVLATEARASSRRGSSGARGRASSRPRRTKSDTEGSSDRLDLLSKGCRAVMSASLPVVYCVEKEERRRGGAAGRKGGTRRDGGALEAGRKARHQRLRDELLGELPAASWHGHGVVPGKKKAEGRNSNRPERPTANMQLKQLRSHYRPAKSLARSLPTNVTEPPVHHRKWPNESPDSVPPWTAASKYCRTPPHKEGHRPARRRPDKDPNPEPVEPPLHHSKMSNMGPEGVTPWTAASKYCRIPPHKEGHRPAWRHLDKNPNLEPVEPHVDRGNWSDECPEGAAPSTAAPSTAAPKNCRVPPYSEGQQVMYGKGESSSLATIVKVHLDGQLNPYYTISLEGREKQTDGDHLSVLPPAEAPEDSMRSSSAIIQDIIAEHSDGVLGEGYWVVRCFEDGGGRRMSAVSLPDALDGSGRLSLMLDGSGRLSLPGGQPRRHSMPEHPVGKKEEKQVRFSASSTIRCYERDYSDDEADELFYNRSDDMTFSDDTLANARAVREQIKTSITDEETFNPVTGLPSPEVLKEHLVSPEDIIGIEHLLCDRAVAKASLNFKTNYLCLLLSEQEKGLDTEELANVLGMYSRISADMAVCRAKYATMF